jgi:L-rhamnose isomerase
VRPTDFFLVQRIARANADTPRPIRWDDNHAFVFGPATELACAQELVRRQHAGERGLGVISRSAAQKFGLTTG